jgi:hypothetical protein
LKAGEEGSYSSPIHHAFEDEMPYLDENDVEEAEGYD